MRRFPLLVLAVAVSSAWATEVQEQSATLPSVVVKSNATLPGSLKDSAQTGSKTDTPIRDLPASVVVVPQEIMRDQGVTDMNQAMTNVSGVQPVMGGGYGFANNYAIRGQAMRFLRDGYSDGTSQNGYWRTFADVDRIEVLKGPGSALYGASQPGGTINVVTKVPRRTFGAELSATVGSFGTYNTTADVTGPISSQLSGRLIVNTEKTDGWRNLSRKITEVLPSFAWQINESSALTIDYDHRELEITPDNYGLPFDVRRNIVPVSREAKYYSPFNYSKQNIDRLTLAHEWLQFNGLTVRTALIQDRRTLDMVRNAGGNPGNTADDMTGRNVRRQTDDARYLNFQNEVIWKTGGPSAQHTLLGGIELTNTHVDTVRIGYNLPSITDINNPVVPEATLPTTAVASQGFDRTLSARGWALYAQDQIAFGEQFKVRAGLRTEQSKVEDDGSQAGALRTVKDTVSFTTGSLGAVWQPSTTTSLYAGWSNGKFVNLSTEPSKISSSADRRTVQPEGSTQFELGAKLSWLEGKLDLTSALFKTQRKDYYITLPGATDPTPDGSDETTGLELDLTAHPVAGLTTTANLVVQDVQTTSTSLASNAQLGITNASISGKRPTGVANTAARLWAAYRLQEATLRGFGFGGGLTYKGASYADALNVYRTPSYVVVDGQLFYETKSWDVNLALRNLTDRTYYTNATFSGALPGEGRSAFLTARVRF
ncbi:TonB-dependent receptor [Aquabacterium sp.]|uniref:TonB-dependent receptor n=1 Tax=Aquabacterium sp. TaxID=1872578 RepID=UPI002E2F6A71|nr:TonB-dependent receptor [Aquabacterium sp.]HEX5312794.1 TonB-dependent receptor [Aquabacterium sp.]